MKQTAVEWLLEQIGSSKYFYKVMEDINSRSTVAQCNIFEQAKEMEKEQIIDTYWASYNEGKYRGDKTADEYYNKTFKQE
jgi:hypothetical protein